MCLPRPSRAAATAGGEYTVVAQLSCGVESCAPKPEASLRLRKQKRFEIFMMVVSNLLMLTPTTRRNGRRSSRFECSVPD